MKRIILALLLTCICLAFGKNLFLPNKINVQFNVQATTDIDFAVYYLPEGVTEFNEKNVVHKKINILPPPVASFQ